MKISAVHESIGGGPELSVCVAILRAKAGSNDENCEDNFNIFLYKKERYPAYDRIPPWNIQKQ